MKLYYAYRDVPCDDLEDRGNLEIWHACSDFYKTAMAIQLLSGSAGASFLVISCMASTNRTMLYFFARSESPHPFASGWCFACDIGPPTMDSDPKNEGINETTRKMEGASSSHPYWRAWGDMLHPQHLDGITAWLLEASRPLALLSAQLLYIGEPFLGPRALRLAQLLESDTDADGFTDHLITNRDAGDETKGGMR